MAFLPRAVALLLAALPVAGSNGELGPGFEAFYNLDYDTAIGEFRKEIAGQPDSPAAYNHLAQAILYRHMFRAGALETELVSGNNPFLRRPKVEPSAADQKEFDESIAKAMELSQARLRQNPNDASAMYLLWIAHGLRANYGFLVRKAWMDALRDATAARKLHNKVSQLEPSNVDARLVQGLHDYVVGSLPWTWRFLGFLVGFRGDKDEGIRTIELVAREGHRNRVDAKIILAAIYRREKMSHKAIPVAQELSALYPRNFLLRFELVQMYSDSGQKEAALQELAAIESLKGAGAPGYDHVPLEKIFYTRGNLQFWYGDLDAALENVLRASQHADALDLNTGVLALMRLGQIYDLKGQRQEALEAYRRAIAYAPESDAARESRGYLSRPYRREKAG